MNTKLAETIDEPFVIADGIHIVSDLYECDLTKFVIVDADLAALKSQLLEMVRSHGLNALHNYFHFFGPSEVTAMICFDEAHLAFRSWPDSRLVTLDIFVCNYTKDLTAAADSIYDKLKRLTFKAGYDRTTRISR